MTAGGQAQIGNVDLVKQLNSAAVYRLIDQHGPISRIQIAEQSQLAPASVTKITRQLIERGLIKEVDQQASTGGRRAISIIAETRNFNAIGVRLGRYDATLTLYDLSSKTLEEEHFPLPERTQETVTGGLAAILASACCLGPLVLVALGFSGAWIGNLTVLEPYRPIFIGAALVALFFAWRRIYRPTQACKPGEVCAIPQVRATYKLIFWVVAVLVLVALGFPYVMPFFY